MRTAGAVITILAVVVGGAWKAFVWYDGYRRGEAEIDRAQEKLKWAHEKEIEDTKLKEIQTQKEETEARFRLQSVQKELESSVNASKVEQ